MRRGCLPFSGQPALSLRVYFLYYETLNYPILSQTLPLDGILSFREIRIEENCSFPSNNLLLSFNVSNICFFYWIGHT